MIGRVVGTYRVLAVAGAGATRDGPGLSRRRYSPRATGRAEVHRPAAVDPQSRARFLREARALAALSHPNIATLYEAGDAEGVPFLAMEWVEGPTLEQTLWVIQRREQLRFTTEPRRALAVVSEGLGQDLEPDVAPELRIANAIDFAHRAGAEGGNDVVGPQARTGSHMHGWTGDSRAARVTFFP
jgi:eukaryotic-like serine/threonine-protein kinase